MTWFEAVVLTLGAFSLTRLVGWDELTVDLRTRVTGIADTRWVALAKHVEAQRAAGMNPFGGDLPERRYYFAKLIRCPWCVGFWISCGVLAAWWIEPRWTLILLAPFAMRAVVGLVAKQLDP